MAASVSASHVFGAAKLIFDAGGTEPAKSNIRTDPFAMRTDPYIYIYSPWAERSLHPGRL
jgi:hypothetical protein